MRAVGKNHILIESSGAYEFVRSSDKEKSESVWYTSSPWVFEKVLMDGGEGFYLDSWISQTEMNQIGAYCREASTRIGGFLDDKYVNWPYGTKVGYCLLISIRKTLFVLFYKLFLLYSFVNSLTKSRDNAFIVGDCELSPIRGFYTNVGRFDTVYAALARHTVLPENVEVIRHQEEGEKKKLEKLHLLGQSRYERLVSLLNLNRTQVFSKIWKLFLRSGDISFLFKKALCTVFLYKSSELLDESTLHLFLNGARVFNVQFSQFSGDISHTGVNEVDPWSISEILRMSDPYRLPGGFEILEAVKVTADILADRLNRALKFGWDWAHCLKSLSKKYSLEKNGKGSRQLPRGLVTSSLAAPMERALAFLLRSRQVRIFASEHGVTHGLTEMSRQNAEDQSGILTSDSALFYSKASARIHADSSRRLERFVCGAPLVNRNLKFRGLQRFLTRKLIDLPYGARLVVYVANLYSNNSIYNPGICNDFYYHNLKKSVVYDILGKTNDHCLLKLYPTHRYLDDDPFLDLMKLPNNVKVIQYFEFRYLRAVGDLIICDSPQSTLGWVWSSRVPLIFLDLPSNPLLPEIAEAFDEAVFRVDCSKQGWIDGLKELLSIPHSELLRIWKDKEKVRRKVEENYIFGPPGNSGKRAAITIIEKILSSS